MKKQIITALGIVLVAACVFTCALTNNVEANVEKQTDVNKADIQSISETGDDAQIIIDNEHQRVAESRDNEFLYRSTNDLDSQIVTVETFDLTSGELVDTVVIDLSSVSAEELVR